MNFEPLLTASPAIQLHVATVVPAAILGAYILTTRKGTRRHKALGRIWIALMVVTSVSTFFIHTIRLWGPFSPIHLLSVLVIAGSYLAVRAARQRKIAAHKSLLKGIYIGGIGIAGLFTLAPGRIMNQVVLGGWGPADLGSSGVTIAGAILAGVVAIAYRFRGRFQTTVRRH